MESNPLITFLGSCLLVFGIIGLGAHIPACTTNAAGERVLDLDLVVVELEAAEFDLVDVLTLLDPAGQTAANVRGLIALTANVRSAFVAYQLSGGNGEGIIGAIELALAATDPLMEVFVDDVDRQGEVRALVVVARAVLRRIKVHGKFASPGDVPED